MQTQISGPMYVWGQGAPIATGQPPSGDYNADVGPSAFAVGTMFPDQRFPVQLDGAAGSAAAYGIWCAGDLVGIDQAPSTIATANIAVLAHTASGVAMTLVSTTAAGITVTTAATVIPQTGKTVASGALAIDLVPALITFGQNKTMQSADPRQNIARVLSISGVSGGAGGAFLVSGADLYGQPQTETITAAAGAATTNGVKGWKFILSVTPQFTDAHNYSVGTADLFEFPIAAYLWAGVTVYWNNTLITASTGFVAAVTTTPSPTTGSVRGTYAVQDASDGTKKLQVFCRIFPYNAASLNGTASIYGRVPA